MIIITNEKVAGFEPRWASFRGFSLLFDNPGESVSPMGKDLLKLDCPVDANPSLQLYESFVNSLDKIGRNSLTNAYLFCPLPSYSYHVTVWDGLNDGNAKNVFPGYRLDLGDFLARLPGSLLVDSRFTSEIDDSPLLVRTGWTIKFKFSELAKWGHQVLVARLVPADGESESELRRIVAGRENLSARFQKLFGVKTTGSYAPHVSLGYFANVEQAESATSQVDHWTDLVKEEAGDLSITFRSISLYGFTDMATFFTGKEPWSVKLQGS